MLSCCMGRIFLLIKLFAQCIEPLVAPLIRGAVLGLDIMLERAHKFFKHYCAKYLGTLDLFFKVH